MRKAVPEPHTLHTPIGGVRAFGPDRTFRTCSNICVRVLCGCAGPQGPIQGPRPAAAGYGRRRPDGATAAPSRSPGTRSRCGSCRTPSACSAPCPPGHPGAGVEDIRAVALVFPARDQRPIPAVAAVECPTRRSTLCCAGERSQPARGDLALERRRSAARAVANGELSSRFNGNAPVWQFGCGHKAPGD